MKKICNFFIIKRFNDLNFALSILKSENFDITEFNIQ